MLENEQLIPGCTTTKAVTSSSARIVIVDYSTGNTNSIKRALDRTGSLSVISSQVKEIAQADKLILPGVGSFHESDGQLKGTRITWMTRLPGFVATAAQKPGHGSLDLDEA